MTRPTSTADQLYHVIQTTVLEFPYVEDNRPRVFPQVLVTLAATGFVLIVGTLHCCHLHSIVVEVGLALILLCGCSYWTSRATTRGQAWQHTVHAFLIAFVVQLVYLAWLHSPVFPRVLLSPEAKEVEERLHERLEKLNAQQAVEGKTPDSASSENPQNL